MLKSGTSYREFREGRGAKTLTPGRYICVNMCVYLYLHVYAYVQRYS
jgi:hypothetical protein